MTSVFFRTQGLKIDDWQMVRHFVEKENGRQVV
jgi:hypothetical protein